MREIIHPAKILQFNSQFLRLSGNRCRRGEISFPPKPCPLDCPFKGKSALPILENDNNNIPQNLPDK